MSKYTTELRYICERAADYDESVGYGNVQEVLDKSWNKIFNFNFPIFDESYREILCKKILKHYYTREIGFETAGLWQLKLDTKMNEIMPYYNKMYESELIEFNPLQDADYTKTHEGETAGTGNDVGSHTGTVNDAGTHGGTISDNGEVTGERHDVGNQKTVETTWDVYSDTPQGALTNVDENTYLTNARKITHESETDSTNDSQYNEETDSVRTFNETSGNLRTYNEGNSLSRRFNNTDEYLEHVTGKMPGKTYMSMIKELRENFLNIDMLIITDLSELFMRIW